MRLSLLLMFTLLIINMVSAESSYVFKQNAVSDLKVPCYDANNNLCSNSVTCTLTINYPNGTSLILNQAMTWTDGYYNYTNSYSQLGTYSSSMNCCDGTTCGFSTINFDVTVSGTSLTGGQSSLYIAFTILGFILFIICLYGAFKIPYANIKGNYGEVVGINYYKYGKILCIVFAYLILMFDMGLVRGVAANFINVIGVAGLFEWIYTLMITILWPLIVCTLIFGLIIYLNDKKLAGYLQRGIPFR